MLGGKKIIFNKRTGHCKLYKFAVFRDRIFLYKKNAIYAMWQLEAYTLSLMPTSLKERDTINSVTDYIHGGQLI